MPDTNTPLLFEPLQLRGVTLRNRIGMSPMCQYSSDDGFANDWHRAHLVSRAIGGVGLVITEATAVVPEGRISFNDLGIWKDDHVTMLARIVADISTHGAVPGMQLAHAGRKAATRRPWEGGEPTSADAPEGWQSVAPSPIAYNSQYQVPVELTVEDIAALVDAFALAAKRALRAGFQLVELHSAHGYLLHDFLSPLSNLRTDQYGGSFENRTRFVLEVTRAVRAVWPDDLPLAVRLSATDYMIGGWGSDDTIRLAQLLRDEGVDIVDCSSGGLHPDQQIAPGPGYQVEFARAVRAAGVASAAVGVITEPAQAERYLQEGDCDLVLLGRELLRNPYWPQRAAVELGVDMIAAGIVPVQYLRAVRQR